LGDGLKNVAFPGTISAHEGHDRAKVLDAHISAQPEILDSYVREHRVDHPAQVLDDVFIGCALVYR
jgi:hypothetical protein